MRDKRGRILAVVSLLVAGGGATLSGDVRPTDATLTSVELVLQTGHTSEAKAIVHSPDRRWLATGSDDSTIKLWDAATGRQLRTLVGHAREVRVLAVSPDARWLASASPFELTIRLWDVATGREVHILRGHTGGVYSLTFSLDAKLLASGGGDSSVRVWETASGKQLRAIAGPETRVRSLVFSIDGRWLASGTKAWEVATGREAASADALKFSEMFPPRRDSAAGHAVPGLTGRAGAVRAVATSTDGRWFATLGDRGGLRIWEMATGRYLRFVGGGADSPVAISGNWQWLAAVGKLTSLWDMATGLERSIAGHDARSVALSADGRWLATAEKTVRLWDTTSRREVRSFVGHSDYIGAIAFSGDGRLIATGSDDETVRIWDLASGKLLQSHKGERMSSVAFSPDGRWLIAGEWYGGVRVIDVAAGREVRSFDTAHASKVTSVAFTLDGRRFASGSRDRTVKLWDPQTGKTLRTLAGHTREVSGLAFSVDGRRLISASLDGSVRVWDPESGDHLATVLSLDNGVDWLVVSPDGLFDGSPAAWSQVLWRFGGQTFDVVSAEIFFNDFYYPGLLADIFAGRAPKAQRSIAQLDRRQPALRLSVGAAPVGRAVDASIDVTEARGEAPGAGSGARDVRLFRNGALVKAWRGDVLRGEGGKVTLRATVPIVAGENRLTAYAFNRDNVKSADTEAIVTGADSLRRKGTAYIVSIGINEYANSDFNLRYAVADAQAFSGEIFRQQTRLAAFEKIELVALRDRTATRANVLLTLELLAGRRSWSPGMPQELRGVRAVRPEDTVVIFYAGHGMAQGSRFFLIPHDIAYRGRQRDVDAAAQKAILSRSISDVELEQAFEAVDAGRLLLVIDACNSGQALEAEERRRGPMNSKGLAQLAYEKGMFILTAAQGYQAALEAERLGHGIFTYVAVEEGLKTAAADTSPKDGRITVREWFDFASLRVPDLQVAMMEDSHRQGRNLAFVDGERSIAEPTMRSLQRPRAFYRPDAEMTPFIVSVPDSVLR